MTFSSLMSNFFYLIWSSLYKPARSSLFTLLALSDLSLTFCGLSLLLSSPDENIFTRFPDIFHPWIFLNFCLSLFFPLLSLVAVVAYLIKEVCATLAIEKEAACVDSNIKEMKNTEKGIKNLLFLMMPSCVIAFGITCMLSMRINVCYLLFEPPTWTSSLSSLSVQCSLNPSSSWLTQKLSELVLNPLHFPLTMLAVLPVLIILAKTNTMFQEHGNRHGRKLGWIIFLSVYSLFICDLFIFSQSSGERFLELKLQPLEWRKSAGSVVRNGAFIIIHRLLIN